MGTYNFRFLSKSLLRKVDINLVIPSLNLGSAMQVKSTKYYQENEKKYPLMILLSGFSDDNDAWLTKSDIQQLCDEYQVAAAFLGGENKWYLNVSPIDNWSTLINEELPDFLYGNFSKLDASLPLILGGVSMGGYGALYNGLKQPTKYAALLALSPGLKPDASFSEEVHGNLRDMFLKEKNRLPFIYLAVGTKDFIIEPSIQFDNWLKENNFDLRYKFAEGFDHSWNLWKLEIVNFLMELKNKKII